MNSSEESTRLRSVHHRRLNDLFTPDLFPVTTEEILEQFDELTIEYPHSSESLTAILTHSGSETYTDQLALEQAILNGVSRAAVGRPRYSDRGLEQDYRDSMGESF
jgi:hypothetical protein